MTEKQEKILNTAKKLFSEKGYSSTSTSAIAKEAGVSEGLIFRHYGNKEGLLLEIIREGEEVVKAMLFPIVMESDPKMVIKKTIELPFEVREEDFDFWRLQFKLKWELKDYTHEKMRPFEISLASAFKQLDYKSPELEAEYLVLYIEAIGEAILKNLLHDKENMKLFLLQKYNV